MNRFDWSDARSLAEASDAAREGALIKAGGLDLLDLMKEGLASPRRLVSLRFVPGLARISEEPDGLRIGATATLTRLAEHPLIRSRYGALAQASASTASPQVRNVATIGGNLLQRPRCWYFRSAHHLCVRKGGATCFAFSGENQYHAIFGHNGCAMVHPSTPATPLVAFDARVELIDPQGARRVVALEEFLLRPEQDIARENDLRTGEILVAVVLPPPRDVRSSYVRQNELDSFDWPLADVAVALEVDGGGVCRRASVILGAAAPTPYRARQSERLLTGRAIDERAAAGAAHAALEGAMPLSRNAYKLPIFEALVKRAILGAMQRV